MIEIKVDGLAELRHAMRQLPDNIARTVLRGAVNAGAGEIAKEVSARAPEDTGTLKRAIYRKHIRELSGDLRQTFFVGVRSGKKYQAVKKGKRTVNMDAWYWRFIEFGHFTRRVKGDLIKAMKTEGVRWIPARPFLRPGFEAATSRAIEAVRAYLAKRIPIEAAKLRSRP